MTAALPNREIPQADHLIFFAPLFSYAMCTLRSVKRERNTRRALNASMEDVWSQAQEIALSGARISNISAFHVLGTRRHRCVVFSLELGNGFSMTLTAEMMPCSSESASNTCQRVNPPILSLRPRNNSRQLIPAGVQYRTPLHVPYC